MGGWGGVVFKWMVTRIGFVEMEIDARDRVPSDSWPCAPELIKKTKTSFSICANQLKAASRPDPFVYQSKQPFRNGFVWEGV